MEQLKAGLWYRSTQSTTNSIYFLAKISPNPNNPHFSYGINGVGEWSESMSRCFPEFQPAEKWVVSYALKGEARRRYAGKKIKCLTDSPPIEFTGKNIDFYLESNSMLSDGALIYRNGEWADVIDGEIEIIKEIYYEIY